MVPRANNAFTYRFLKSLDDYFSNTSVHGVKYLTENQRPLFERFVWFTGIVIAFTACGLLIRASWRNRWETPVILTLEKKQHAIWDIPFPAVTVCPFEGLTSGVRPETYELEDDTLTDLNCVREILCQRSIGAFCENATDPLKFIEMVAKSDVEIILKVQMGEEMSFENDIISQFTPLLTIDGVCYAFNMFPPTHLFSSNTFHGTWGNLNVSRNINWNPQMGYKTKHKSERYPVAPTGKGQHSSLTMLLIEDISEGTCGVEKGFKVQLHNPAELPSSESEYFVPLDSHVQIIVEPDLTFTKRGELENYSAKHRQCYFPGEYILDFFKVYTQNNCDVECYAKTIFTCCQCVPYFLPRNVSSRICRKTDDMCISSVNNKGSNGEIPCSEAPYCKCLPSCSHLQYRGRNTWNNLERRLILPLLNDSSLDNTSVSVVEIFFPSIHFIPIRRMELKGTIDFIADCGGVLGLCLGMSLLSLVELAYWLLVRPGWCRSRRWSRVSRAEMEMVDRQPPVVIVTPTFD